MILIFAVIVVVIVIIVVDVIINMFSDVIIIVVIIAFAVITIGITYSLKEYEDLAYKFIYNKKIYKTKSNFKWNNNNNNKRDKKNNLKNYRESLRGQDLLQLWRNYINIKRKTTTLFNTPLYTKQLTSTLLSTWESASILNNNSSNNKENKLYNIVLETKNNYNNKKIEEIKTSQTFGNESVLIVLKQKAKRVNINSYTIIDKNNNSNNNNKNKNNKVDNIQFNDKNNEKSNNKKETIVNKEREIKNNNNNNSTKKSSKKKYNNNNNNNDNNNKISEDDNDFPDIPDYVFDGRLIMLHIGKKSNNNNTNNDNNNNNSHNNDKYN